MYRFDQLPAPLVRYCHRWHRELPAQADHSRQIAYMTGEMAALLAETDLWQSILAAITTGDPRLQVRRCGLFANEVPLFLDPRRRFSLHLYLYGSGESSFIHDHSAWGVIGSPLAPLQVIKYCLRDAGKEPGTAPIEESQRLILAPGEVDSTLPLDAGIHATGSAGPRPTAMVSVYGKPLRRLFINRFDPHGHTITRCYTPRHHNRMVAQALRAPADGVGSGQEE